MTWPDLTSGHKKWERKQKRFQYFCSVQIKTNVGVPRVASDSDMLYGSVISFFFFFSFSLCSQKSVMSQSVWTVNCQPVDTGTNSFRSEVLKVPRFSTNTSMWLIPNLKISFKKSSNMSVKQPKAFCDWPQGPQWLMDGGFLFCNMATKKQIGYGAIAIPKKGVSNAVSGASFTPRRLKEERREKTTHLWSY